jgi:hypothetical protein
VTSDADDFRQLGAQTPAHPGLAVVLDGGGRAQQLTLGLGSRTPLTAPGRCMATCLRSTGRGPSSHHAEEALIIKFLEPAWRPRPESRSSCWKSSTEGAPLRARYRRRCHIAEGKNCAESPHPQRRTDHPAFPTRSGRNSACRTATSSKRTCFPGVSLRSASANARERAWERICAMTDRVLPSPEQAVRPIEQVEDETVGYVKETRRALRAARKHG